jgi:hypothetical protein
MVVLWEGAQCNVGATLAQSADSLYFATNNGLLRIGKDGSNLTTLAGGRVGPVAVSSSRVFWVDRDGDSIHSADMDGTDQKIVAASPEGKWVYRLQADDNHVYWSGGESTSDGLNRAPVGGGVKTELSTSRWITFALQDGTIFGLTVGQLMRINADGTGQTVLASMAGGAWGLFVDSQIFWGTLCSGGSDCNKSWRAEKDGSGVTTVNSFGASAAYVADADSLYMSFTGQIFRMKRDGTLPETLVNGVKDVRAECLLADDDFLYWFDGDGQCNSRLARFPK